MYMDCTGAAKDRDVRERPAVLYKMLHYSVYLFRLHNESYYAHFRSAFLTDKGIYYIDFIN